MGLWYVCYNYAGGSLPAILVLYYFEHQEQKLVPKAENPRNQFCRLFGIQQLKWMLLD